MTPVWGGNATDSAFVGRLGAASISWARVAHSFPFTVMGTLKGFPYPPAMVRRRHSRRAPHATVMGTLKGFPNPPAMVRRRHSRRAPHATVMGTLKGFPNPPAMVRRRHSRRAPQATMPSRRATLRRRLCRVPRPTVMLAEIRKRETSTARVDQRRHRSSRQPRLHRRRTLFPTRLVHCPTGSHGRPRRTQSSLAASEGHWNFGANWYCRRAYRSSKLATEGRLLATCIR
jgi:hypothetical protein